MSTTQQPEALRGAPPSAYSQEDHAFYTFWYGHMLNDLMQPPLAGVSHSTARYIWDAAIAHVAAQPAAPQGAAYAALPEPDLVSKQCDSTMRYTTVRSFSESQMRAFADATCAIRAPHGQAPAPINLNCESEQKRLATLWGFVPAQAAPAAVAGPKKWAPEEVEDGERGIRWVTNEGIHGRPTDHDVREYLNRTPTAKGCLCDECTVFYASAPTAQPAPQQEPSHTAVQLAELVLSDCGHSSNYTPLLDRVAARIDSHVERRLDELRRCLESKPAPQQEAQEPHGWLYEWTHSSATGKPDATYTAFTTDEAHASKHDNCRAVYTAPQPSPASQGDALDAARLDWLLLHISGAEFRRIGVHYSGNARRADVDAARKQGGA